MPRSTVYLDECVNQYTAQFLARRGAVVVTTQAADMSAVTDEDQLDYATANSYVLLTTNLQHFIRLHAMSRASERAHGGIVAGQCAMLVDWIAGAFPDPHNRLFRWTDLQQRLICGYLLEGYTDAELAIALGRTAKLR